MKENLFSKEGWWSFDVVVRGVSILRPHGGGEGKTFEGAIEKCRVQGRPYIEGLLSHIGAMGV